MPPLTATANQGYENVTTVTQARNYAAKSRFLRELGADITSASSHPSYAKESQPTTLPSPTVIKFRDRVSKSEAKNKLEGALFNYSNVEEDWDGYGGIPASSDAVSDAIVLINKLPHHIPLPYPMLSGDGEVGLYWEADGIYIELGCYGDGTFSYYAESSDGTSIGNEDVPIGSFGDESPLLSVVAKLFR